MLSGELDWNSLCCATLCQTPKLLSDDTIQYEGMIMANVSPLQLCGLSGNGDMYPLTRRCCRKNFRLLSRPSPDIVRSSIRSFLTSFLVAVC
jgi:hypothetical protein